MAGPFDPFNPGQDTTPFGGVDPSMFDNLRQQWGTFLSDPKGRAAMMSMGLALTQPPSFGDNALSQLGRAVGSAGQSVQFAEAQDQKDRELASKDAMREAQAAARLQTAEAATSRADAAQTRAAAAGDRAGFQMERLKAMQENMSLRERLGASLRYQTYKQGVEKANQTDALMNPGKPPRPIMSYPEFLKTMGFSQTLAGTPEDGDVPPEASTTPAGPSLSGVDQQALDWAKANPNDPRAAKIRARLGL